MDLRLFCLHISFLGFLVTIFGCSLHPTTDHELIGKYEGCLPDGGIEMLELLKDKTCIQKISLKDGEKINGLGTWEFKSGYVEFISLHNSVDVEGKINPNIGKIANGKIILPVERNIAGQIIIGSTEGVHYRKMH